MPGDRDLTGKVVLITGASAGIGAALARSFARRGARLLLTARRLDRLQALADELSPATAALAVRADVTQDGSIEAAVAAGVERFGGLDVAVANAGFGVVGDVARLTLDDYRRQLETNFFGAIRTTYAALPHLRQSRGRLAFIGSVSGHVPLRGMSPYSASKFALRGFAHSIVDDLAPVGVSVTLLSPGFVVSDIGRVDNNGQLHDRDASRAPAWLRVPTDRAAAAIVAAIAARKREAVITAHGKFLVFLYRHCPWLLRAATAPRRARPASPPGVS